MSEIATIALPFFGLIFLGYGAGRLNYVPPEALAGLNFLAYYLALPALFFLLVARTPFGELTNWSFVLTTTFSTYCAFAIAFSFAALVNRGNVPEATIQGLAGSYANIGFMAPGLTLAAFGADAAAPTALVLSFDAAMLAVLTPLMMVLGETDRANGGAIARNVGREIFLHPLILATIAGFFVSAVGIGIPGPLDSLLSFIGAGAAPVALFVVGLSLSGKRIGKVPPDLPVLIGIKLVIHPLIVYLLMSWIGGFDPVWVDAAVLMAALPPAANVLAIARKYDSAKARASAAILLGTFASVVTVLVTLTLVVHDLLPVDPFR